MDLDRDAASSRYSDWLPTMEMYFLGVPKGHTERIGLHLVASECSMRYGDCMPGKLACCQLSHQVSRNMFLTSLVSANKSHKQVHFK